MKVTDTNNTNVPVERADDVNSTNIARTIPSMKVLEAHIKEMNIDPLELMRLQEGEPQSVVTIPFARKLSGADDNGDLKRPNNQWMKLSVNSKTDPFANLIQTSDGTTAAIENSTIDCMYDGEGVDVVCMDGGSGVAISNHPEWMSTKYPGLNRFIKYDWSSTNPFPAITLQSVRNPTNNIDSTTKLPKYGNIAFRGTDLINPNLGYLNTEDFYSRRITVVSGPGAGQTRLLSGVTYWYDDMYYGFTTPAWDIVHNSSTSQNNTGSTSNVALAPSASNVNGAYVGMSIRITSGSAVDDNRVIVAYDGVTKIATIDVPWDDNQIPSIGDTYTISNTPTTDSVLRIESFTQPSNYYDTFTTSTHGTGTVGLAGGKTYGYARESMLYSIGSHGSRYVVSGNIGAFSFSNDSIITTNSSVSSRLSYLQSDDFITVSGATSVSNNNVYQVVSNTIVNSTRTIVVRKTNNSNYVFVPENAAAGTTINLTPSLWGMSQGIDLVTAFHKNKTDKSRPTVFCLNLSITNTFSSTDISACKVVLHKGEYKSVDFTTTAGRTLASNSYNVPIRSTASRSFVAYSAGVALAINRAIDAGVIVVNAAGNYDHRIVDSSDLDFNDCLVVPLSTISSPTVSGSTSSTVTFMQAVTDTVLNKLITVTIGTVPHTRMITNYDATTQTVTVSPTWEVLPTSGAVCTISNTKLVYFNRSLVSSSPGAIVTGAVIQQYFNGMEIRASYSNMGPRVDAFAPADGTVTASFDVTTRTFWNGTDSNGSDIMQTHLSVDPMFKAGSFSGTSASTPIITGVAACIAQARPWIDSGGVRSAIHSSSTKGRLYDTSDFSDRKSLGGAENRFIWYPFQHIDTDQ